ncbi:hypothetical protein NE237_006673 [Protea cynaroides]|uniref:Uncharacterized protein n=1 Tax=Protea cynaroides TaxID=273540 RepID=A0A9Q0QVR5_9MAGN|nr:hypothetical protein NE237_006673 [Protea cynaroides]
MGSHSPYHAWANQNARSSMMVVYLAHHVAIGFSPIRTCALIMGSLAWPTVRLGSSSGFDICGQNTNSNSRVGYLFKAKYGLIGLISCFEGSPLRLNMTRLSFSDE